MKRLLAAAVATLAVPTLLLAGAATAQDRPNIVFIMADDLGNADLGYRGGEVISPNLDALAAEGVRLESFYGEPVCTPSRAALMTGRYPMRHGLQTLVIFPSHTYGLPLEERTLPQALHDAGYETWMVGKWHLGHADRKYWPQNRGFDHFYGNVMGEVNYFTRERGGLIDWQRDGAFLKEDGYYTTLIGDEAVKLIESYDGEKPFFLYFASLAPHAPYEAPDSYKAMYADVADPQKPNLLRHDHRARRSGRPDRRRAGRQGPAQRHHHPLRQRQWRRHQRHVRERLEVAGGTRDRGRRDRAGCEGTGEQRPVPRRQGKPLRGRGSRARNRRLAGQARASRRGCAAAHDRRDANAAGAGRRARRPGAPVRWRRRLGNAFRRAPPRPTTRC